MSATSRMNATRDLRPGEDTPVYVISVAAQLAGLHPQTLRQYDRLGLVSPGRSDGRNRLYSMRDIARIRRVQEMSANGINLAGILRILELEAENESLRNRVRELAEEQTRSAIVVWRPQPAHQRHQAS